MMKWCAGNRCCPYPVTLRNPKWAKNHHLAKVSSLSPSFVQRLLCQTLCQQALLLERRDVSFHLEEGTVEGKDSSEGNWVSELLRDHASGP